MFSLKFSHSHQFVEASKLQTSKRESMMGVTILDEFFNLYFSGVTKKQLDGQLIFHRAKNLAFFCEVINILVEIYRIFESKCSDRVVRIDAKNREFWAPNWNWNFDHHRSQNWIFNGKKINFIFTLVRWVRFGGLIIYTWGGTANTKQDNLHGTG